MTSKIEYRKKLQDPRWQRKRLGILNRDEFTCQCCGATKKTLHVHHKRYSEGDPWEIPDYCLVTLCEHCHLDETEFLAGEVRYLVAVLKERFSSDEIAEIAGFIDAKADPSEWGSHPLDQRVCTWFQTAGEKE